MGTWLQYFENPYAEDDELLNDWVERTLRFTSWELFNKQDKIVYFANETDNGIPKLKEGALDVIHQTIIDELGWLRSYMLGRILVAYAKGNIDLGEEGKQYLDDQFDSEDTAEFWNEIYQYIWDDYSKMLGEERTAELWEKWGYPPLGKDKNE